jgi:hypothetical protein
MKAQEYTAAAERIEETRAALDNAVFTALQHTPTPAIEICRMIGMDWGTEAGELRGSFLRLQEQGKADIRYGHGWFRTAAS